MSGIAIFRAIGLPFMRLLLFEFWGLGDAVFMSAALREWLRAGFEITVACKPGTKALLQPSFPELRFIVFDPPWTVFRGKYRLLRWPWRALAGLVRECRRGRFDFAASVRPDPRDHLLMWLSGARQRLGFPRAGSRPLLTMPLPAPGPDEHRVASWGRIGSAILSAARSTATSPPPAAPETASTPPGPWLSPDAYGPPPPGFPVSAPGSARLPIVALHCGARIAVRRWREDYYRQLITKLRASHRFHLALFPDPDGYGESLRDLADSHHPSVTLPQLVAGLGACDLLLCNDSAPGHIAAALDVPVVAIFGPTHPGWFRPYGADHLVVIRDLCAYRPCFDYCRFPEPYCLTRLLPDDVWPEIQAHLEKLSASGRLAIK